MQNRIDQGHAGEDVVTLNQVPGSMDAFDADTQLNVFRRMCMTRMFEKHLRRVNPQKFGCRIHLSCGQEAVAAALGTVISDAQFFPQHRSMDLYLSLGGSPEMLRDEMLGLDSGCSGGMAGVCIQNFQNGKRMYAYTGLLGENVSTGVGACMGNRDTTVCVFGDGAAEEDYVLSAFGFAQTHSLPVLFVCTDNDFSVLTRKFKRRAWKLANVARGFGMEAYELCDDPFSIMHHIVRWERKAPLLLDVKVCRDFWHVGFGQDNPPAWCRYEMVADGLRRRGHGGEVDAIIRDVDERMEAVWRALL